MVRNTSQTATTNHVQKLLATSRFEVMPFESFDNQVSHLPNGSTITVTASPQLGIERTIKKTEVAAAEGYEVVPHIAARYIRDGEHLEDIAARLADAGVTDIFVPGGDPDEPKGEFESAYELLLALNETDYSFDEVGITGYPEGHPFLSDETLAKSMEKKAPYATYITTQLCFDPQTVINWTREIRSRGVDLPVFVGIPGVMKYQRLLSISQKVGVGQSIQFLRKTSGILDFLRQLIGSRGKYVPDDLVDGLEHADNPGLGGVHIYTFNQVQDTESWRQARVSE